MSAQISQLIRLRDVLMAKYVYNVLCRLIRQYYLLAGRRNKSSPVLMKYHKREKIQSTAMYEIYATIKLKE